MEILPKKKIYIYIYIFIYDKDRINKNKVTECNGPSDVVSSWLTVVWEPGTLASWN